MSAGPHSGKRPPTASQRSYTPWVANVRVTVTGAVQLARRLDKLGRDLKSMPLDEETRLVKRRATQEAPKLTGRLSRDVETRNTRPGEGRVQLGPLAYGPPIHEGDRQRNIRRNDYLNRAARRERADVVRSVQGKVRRYIRTNDL